MNEIPVSPPLVTNSVTLDSLVARKVGYGGDRFGIKRTSPEQPHVPDLQLGVPRETLEELISGKVSISTAFQPIIDFSVAKVVGYEALSSFPEIGEFSVTEVFSQARKLALSEALEARAMSLALQAASSRSMNSFLSLNITPNILNSAAIDTVLPSSLEGVVFELSGAVKNFSSIQELPDWIAKLRRRGANIAVDCSVCDESSLAAIKLIRPEFVKVKRSLIGTINADDAKLSLVSMINDFVSRFGGWTIAEGIETRNELEAVLRVGISMGQGWLLGKAEECVGQIQADSKAIIVELSRSLGHYGIVAPFVGVAEFILPGDYPRTNGGSVMVISMDTMGRAKSLWTRESSKTTAWKVRPITLTVHLEEDISIVAAKALSRDIDFRYDPILCVGPTGVVAGVVEIEALFKYLAEQNSGRNGRVISLRPHP